MVGIDGIFRGIGIRILNQGTVGVNLGSINLAKCRIAYGVLHDFRHIQSTGVMFRIVQSGGVGKMRIRTADFRSLLVHQLRKFFVGAGHMLSQSIGTVVGGMEQQGVKTVSNTQLISRRCGNDSGIVFQISSGGFLGKGDLFFQIFYMLQDNDGG